jgi:hypothetical protein
VPPGLSVSTGSNSNELPCGELEAVEKMAVERMEHMRAALGWYITRFNSRLGYVLSYATYVCDKLILGYSCVLLYSCARLQSCCRQPDVGASGFSGVGGPVGCGEERFGLADSGVECGPRDPEPSSSSLAGFV